MQSFVGSLSTSLQDWYLIGTLRRRSNGRMVETIWVSSYADAVPSYGCIVAEATAGESWEDYQAPIGQYMQTWEPSSEVFTGD